LVKWSKVRESLLPEAGPLHPRLKMTTASMKSWASDQGQLRYMVLYLLPSIAIHRQPCVPVAKPSTDAKIPKPVSTERVVIPTTTPTSSATTKVQARTDIARERLKHSRTRRTSDSSEPDGAPMPTKDGYSSENGGRCLIVEGSCHPFVRRVLSSQSSTKTVRRCDWDSGSRNVILISR